MTRAIDDVWSERVENGVGDDRVTLRAAVSFSKSATQPTKN